MLHPLPLGYIQLSNVKIIRKHFINRKENVMGYRS